jgi:hypothetical protein
MRSTAKAESKDVTNPAGGGKVALDPTDRRTDTIFHNLIDETDSKSAREPVLDHFIEHDQILREEDNARRIAVMKADQLIVLEDESLRC